MSGVLIQRSASGRLKPESALPQLDYPIVAASCRRADRDEAHRLDRHDLWFWWSGLLGRPISTGRPSGVIDWWSCWAAPAWVKVRRAFDTRKSSRWPISMTKNRTRISWASSTLRDGSSAIAAPAAMEPELKGMGTMLTANPVCGQPVRAGAYRWIGVSAARR
jgi:hypothetical protein